MPTAASTAQNLATLLALPAARFSLPTGTILLGEAAKADDIQTAIFDALDAMVAGDLLLVAFSGAACVLSDRDIALVTADYHATRVAQRRMQPLMLAWLRDEVLRATTPGHVVLLLDCHYVTADGAPVAAAVLRAQLADLLDVGVVPAATTRLLQLRLAGFVGRVAERSELRAHIDAMRPTGGYVLIKALAGEGKSCVIAKLVEESGITATPHHMIPLTPGPQHQLSILRTLVAQLILKHSLSATYFPEDSYPAMKDLFATILRQLHERGVEETLYLDGLDQLEADYSSLRDLSFLPPQPSPGIVIVLGSRPDETLRPLDPLTRMVYQLLPLSMEDFYTLLRDRQAAVADHEVAQLYDALGGNALYLTLAIDEMRHTPEADWRTFVARVAADPRGLFGFALDRIKRRDGVAWERVVKPVLAVLVVAQEPLTAPMLRSILTVDHEALRSALERLGGLVSRSVDGHYALYHLKFREYLIEPVAHALERAFLFPADELLGWHQHLVAWCIPTQSNDLIIWEDSPVLGEQARRLYARHHYISHLILGEQWDRLWHIIDEGGYGRHKRQFDPSTQLYAHDLDRARDVAMKTHDLIHLMRSSLLRLSLSSRVGSWPTTFFKNLVLLERPTEALNCVELVSDPVRRVHLLCKLAPMFDPNDARALWQRAKAIAMAIPSDNSRAMALDTLAEALTRIGKLDQARLIADSIPQAEKRVRILAKIAQAMAQVQHPEASAIFDQACAIADSIQAAEDRIHPLISITQALITAGDLDQARAIATTIRPATWQPHMLSDLAAILINHCC